jgi:SAM-dependent methyltransferase
MVERIRRRAEAAGAQVEARTMDGMNLVFPDDAFDAALSVFGVILFPDAARGLEEMRRVVRRGGRVAVVTWTQPERYELAAALREAIDSLGGRVPRWGCPAGPVAVRRSRGVRAPVRRRRHRRVEIETAGAELEAPSARWLAERIRFAPGMEV